MPSSERSRGDVDGPALEQQDRDDLAGVEEPVSRPANGDLRYPAGGERRTGRLAGENDDNPQQRSDEALSDDGEEEAIAEANLAGNPPDEERGPG